MEALPGATFFSCGMSIISALFSDALLFAHGSDVAPVLHGVATQTYVSSYNDFLETFIF